jgi:hypothetical protein
MVAGPALAGDEDKGAIERGADATGNAIKRGAEATGEAVKSGAEATGHAIKSGAEATGAMLGITDTERERFEANQRGRHRVIGTVTDIDHETGKMSLAANGTTYRLHFPPSAVKNVTKGERLAVTSAFALPDKPLAADDKMKRQAAGDQPTKAGHWMTGTVTDVDTAKGTIGVKTDDALLTLHFAPDAVREVRTGEKIAVELAFEPAAASTK